MKKIITFFLVTNILYSQWTENTIVPTPPRLNCVSPFFCFYFPSQSITGWIGGNNGTILFTSNGGTNWIYRTSSIVGTNNINAIAAVDFNTALLSFNNGNVTYILKTTDKGINWQTVFQQQNGFIRVMRFILGTYNCTSYTGYVLGDPVGGRWTFFKTTNFGSTFDSTGLYCPSSGNEIGFNNSFDLKGTYIIFGTNNSKIYKSANLGVNWLSYGLPYQNISSLAIESVFGNVYSGGNQTAKSTNGGVNWSLISIPGSGNCIFNSEQLMYAKGSDIYKSVSPSSWTLDYTSPNGGNYTDISVRVIAFEGTTISGWAVKDNGTVSFYHRNIAGINKISSEIPEKFSLSQNYPNPFNPTTRIRFDVPSLTRRGAGVVVLKVYDALGREVQTLVNETLKPGSYEVEFNGADYSSGIYYYTMSSGDYIETKKMVLVK